MKKERVSRSDPFPLLVVTTFLLVFFNVACFGNETIDVQLCADNGQSRIFVNGVAYKVEAATNWFKHASETIRRDFKIDVRCEPDVPIGFVIAFLVSIDGPSWKSLEVRCIPKSPSNWRDWIVAGKDRVTVPLVTKPSPTSPPRSFAPLEK